MAKETITERAGPVATAVLAFSLVFGPSAVAACGIVGRPYSMGKVAGRSAPCDGTQDRDTSMTLEEAQSYADKHGEDPSTVCFVGVTSATWYVVDRPAS